MNQPKAFISYSHDSDSHRQQVLALSERLRKDGIVTILDRYVQTGAPPEGWPRWMMNGLEEATHVILVCTETYYRRFRGHAEPGKGKGVDWEGAIITQELYDARSKTSRFFPVLFDQDSTKYIPEPLRGQNYYALTSERNYKSLYDAILTQTGVKAGAVGPLQPKELVTAEPLTFADSAAATPSDAESVHIPPHRPERQILGHTYSLMEVKGLVGRRDELALLDEWVTGANEPFQDVPVIVLTAIGGMGKSAVLWHWLRNHAPSLEGHIWWSFYDVPSFDNFVAHSLHFLSGQPLKSCQAMFPKQKSEAYNRLFDELETRNFLVSLDGLERILVAYAMLDAAYMTDEELEARTSKKNGKATDATFPTSNRTETLRRCIDPVVGEFLHRLHQLSKSKVVVSTRLFPFDLQNVTGGCRPGVYEHKLEGLNDEDAVELWHEYGLSGARDDLVNLFRTFDNHPLLIKVLAAEVAKNRHAPGDFKKWRDAHPDFNPFGLPVKQVQTHILQQALSGLSDDENETLSTLAGFRLPTSYDALSAILVREDGTFQSLAELDTTLEALEDRGVLGWDRRANKYDMHPVVRGVVWNLQDGVRKADTCDQLIAFFDSAEEGREEFELVTSIDNLSVPIEKMNLLLRVERFDDASSLWFSRLCMPFERQICYARQYSALLEGFFPGGDILDDHFCDAKYIRRALAQAYSASAQPEKSLPLRRQRAKECNCVGCQSDVASTLRQMGRLAESEELLVGQLGRTFGGSRGRGPYVAILNLWLDRGVENAKVNQLSETCRDAIGTESWESRGEYDSVYNAWERWTTARIRIALRDENYGNAGELACRLWEGTNVENDRGDIIHAGIVQAEVSWKQGNIESARDRVDWALSESRRTEQEALELEALVLKAAIEVECGDHENASECLSDTWLRLSEGPIPKLLSRADLLRAKVQNASGDTVAASDSAIKAYTHAWCDGPPFSLHNELQSARAMCERLGVSPPNLPAYTGDTELPTIEWKKEDEVERESDSWDEHYPEVDDDE